jgi:hypothetical protein
MSISEEREILLSQLVDNELPADRAGQVLMDLLEDPEQREQLKAMLRLRQALEPWRRQEPKQAIVALPLVKSRENASRPNWRPMSLAVAAMLGGVLVACGFGLSGWLRGEGTLAKVDRPAEDPSLQPRILANQPRQPVIVVTPEQRREIARAFALHESVAGPLSWYAADDSTIQVAPAQDGEKSDQPIAVVLRLVPVETGKQSEAKTYVIVCRNNDPAVIELPQSAAVRSAHLRLLSTVANGVVDLQYALAADGREPGPDDSAAVVGRRHVGFGQTSLGQLALNDCLVNVDASAWVIREERKN